MKIAQVVLSKSVNGQWKVIVMSKDKVEQCHTRGTINRAMEEIEILCRASEWEQMTLDL